MSKLYKQKLLFTQNADLVMSDRNYFHALKNLTIYCSDVCVFTLKKIKIKGKMTLRE